MHKIGFDTLLRHYSNHTSTNQQGFERKGNLTQNDQCDTKTI